MCLIILAPRGTEKKSEKLFSAVRLGAVTNKDGMGYMYKEGETIIIEKGFTDVEKLIEKLNTLELNTENGQLAIHLRIGNKGEISPEMCHPFVCSKEEQELKLLEGTTNLPVMMHNGTFIGLTLSDKKSDTYVFAEKFLSEESLVGLMHSNTELFKEIFKSVLSLSRVLVFYPDNRDFVKVGNWIEEDGYFYSNETFKNKDIKDVGGKLVDLRASSKSTKYRSSSNTTFNNRPSNSRIAPMPSDGMSVVYTAGVPSITYTRQVRTDILKDKVLKETNPFIKDNLGYTMYKYKGLIGIDEKIYITDELSFEFEINKFNYKFATLLGKETDDTLGIRQGVYYKIENVVYNSTTETSLAMITRLVSPMIMEDTIYIDINDINKLFSVKPKNDMVSPALFRFYLDAVVFISEHNKSLKRILRNIKGKKDFDLVNVGNKGKIFPCIILKWYIYQLKVHQGNKPERVREFFKTVDN